MAAGTRAGCQTTAREEPFVGLFLGMGSRAILRVDGGINEGLGHLHRCIALASALRECGSECLFLLHGSQEAQRRTSTLGFESVLAEPLARGSTADLNLLLQTARATDCSMLILDSYHIGPEYLASLGSAGLTVTMIDDLATHGFSCQFVVNGAINADRLPYVSTSGNTQFLLGSRYVLLRPEFWNIPERHYSSAVKRVMLTLGGTDQHRLFCQILRILDEMTEDFMISAIVGPFTENRHRIKRCAGECKRDVQLLDAPESLCQAMLDCDLIITAAGQTAYEAVASGTPMIAFAMVDNQIAGLEGFSERGLCTIGDSPLDPNFSPRIANAIKELLGNDQLRRHLGFLQKSLIDGRGAFRVAEILQSAHTYSH